MKKLLLLSVLSVFLLSCETETIDQPQIVQTVTENNACKDYKAEINDQYNQLIEIHLQNAQELPTDVLLQDLIRMHNERIEYLNGACEFIN